MLAAANNGTVLVVIWENHLMKKIYLFITTVTVMLFSSCYTVSPAGNSGKIPPGQAKKMTGSQSARPYAPGQQKH
ncbi:hypothetical protein DF182_27705 [Chitinophaga flava]|uniref:Quinol oxidase subunit 4 n=1 Tax=Chitinophaga flava TaxID=2259036 RepID=A0A365XX23_9BACT|nr:hypothetical protein DF182_27705 [Chitinophaga flava]